MFQVPLSTSFSVVSIENFWNAVLLFHNRPHLANRRLMGVINVLFLRVTFFNRSIKKLKEAFTRSAILYEIRKLKQVAKECINKDFIKNILETYDKNLVLQESSVENFKQSQEDVYVSVRILLPRQSIYENCIEVVILDKKNKVATFFAVAEFDKKHISAPFPYDVEYANEGNLRICLNDIEDAESSSAEWLSDQLFTKLLNWAENLDEHEVIQQSLSLVPIERYTKMYHHLKNKYGDELVKAWPENTDPLKFVYEDIAIATYLITLWETTNPNSKPSFVDLGCGNGLLVYILNEEGYPGYGIDLRKRKIWDLYKKSTTLKVQTITPSDKYLFPQTDWLIGNHSDELTPWVPIIAARSSHKTNFFLLPCCCYEFNGQKYRRVNSSVSTYNEYINYIQDLCKKCGFLTKVDKLRIPSTKRTCLVSFGRSYESEQFEVIDKGISDLIQQDSDANIWKKDFLARSSFERVRNCTQLDKDLITNIILKVSNILLQEIDILPKSNAKWNKGGNVPLSELIEVVGQNDLKELKNQCGGLQTLLKNHRYIFEVVKGSVQLRVPLTAETTKHKYKMKSCWFYKNHPDGCLHDDEVCAYLHEM